MLVTILALLIFTLAWFYLEDETYKNGVLAISLLVAVVFFYLTVKREQPKEVLHFSANQVSRSTAKITELVLLSEEDTEVARWDIYGKTGIVIGRDLGENDVDINLNYVADAGLIDVEHAVLNYCLNNWYIEDLGSKNGISILKSEDGRRYKLASDQPCRLEKGDVIYIAFTKLLIH